MATLEGKTPEEALRFAGEAIMLSLLACLRTASSLILCHPCFLL